MASTIEMPQLGESVVEGTVGQWLVEVGDHVKEGDPLVEIETDKANTEVPALREGYVHELLVEEGETVEVGSDILVLGDEAPSGAKKSAPAPKTSEPKAEEASSDSQKKTQDEPAPAPASSTKNHSAPAAGPSTSRHTASSNTESDGNNYKRAVIDGPSGAQPGGRTAAATARPAIAGAGRPQASATPSSKRGAAPAAAAQPANHGAYGAPVGGKYFKAPAVKAGDDDNVVKFSRRRGIIAEHMVYSKQVSPHVYTMAEVDMTKVQNHRRANKARLKEQGVHLTVFAYIVSAVAQALRETPEMNAAVGDGEIIQFGHVHVGIAVETDGGLVVPVIRDTDSLSVVGVARAISELADKARNKKITVDELTGGTFTVSNPGRKGNLVGFAVINQPQAGIVRMGEIVRRPVVRKLEGEEAIVIRDTMRLSLSYDHRLIDGANANGFLFRIGELLSAGNFEV